MAHHYLNNISPALKAGLNETYSTEDHNITNGAFQQITYQNSSYQDDCKPSIFRDIAKEPLDAINPIFKGLSINGKTLKSEANRVEDPVDAKVFLQALEKEVNRRIENKYIEKQHNQIHCQMISEYKSDNSDKLKDFDVNLFQYLSFTLLEQVGNAIRIEGPDVELVSSTHNDDADLFFKKTKDGLDVCEGFVGDIFSSQNPDPVIVLLCKIAEKKHFLDKILCFTPSKNQYTLKQGSDYPIMPYNDIQNNVCKSQVTTCDLYKNHASNIAEYRQTQQAIATANKKLLDKTKKCQNATHELIQMQSEVIKQLNNSFTEYKQNIANQLKVSQDQKMQFKQRNDDRFKEAKNVSKRILTAIAIISILQAILVLTRDGESEKCIKASCIIILPILIYNTAFIALNLYNKNYTQPLEVPDEVNEQVTAMINPALISSTVVGLTNLAKSVVEVCIKFKNNSPITQQINISEIELQSTTREQHEDIENNNSLVNSSAAILPSAINSDRGPN